MDSVIFPEMGDEKGKLVAIESGLSIPFEVKRVYYIYGTKPDVVRGLHAHRKLYQLLICVSGSCVVVVDDGASRTEYVLSKPNEGLYLQPGVWREMKEFTTDAVLLVLASDHYDIEDYIWDYHKFISEFGR